MSVPVTQHLDRLLLLIVLIAWPLCGCTSFGGADNQEFSYEAMRQQIDGPDPAAYRPMFERSPGPQSAKGLIDGLSPKNLLATAKKKTGNGPKPDAARQLYAQAEAAYQEAMSAPDEERAAKFEQAAQLFDAAGKNWPDSALEQDALFLAGEAHFFADHFPLANTHYERLLKKFPNSPYLDLIEARRFSIAQYWLATADYSSESFFSTNIFDKARPWRDSRGQGLRIHDRIRIDDPTGKLADDATMAAGSLHFRRGNFIRADEFYSDLRKTFPSSEHQFMAHYLGVQAKLRSYEGPDYSGMALDEAEELLKQISKQFPSESQQYKDALNRMYAEVRRRQAEREWTTAQYYERQKAFAAARFYYDIIARDYSETSFAKVAQERSLEIAGKPPRPEQQFQWLVKAFPANQQQKPLLVSRPSATTKR